MSKIRTSLTIAHQTSGLSVTVAQLRDSKNPYFEADILTVIGAGTLELGDIITPQQITFKLISGDNLLIAGSFMGLSGPEDFGVWPLNVAGNIEISDIIAVPDIVGSLNNTYFTMTDRNGLVRVWFSYGGTGAAPGGGRSIHVVIEADDTAFTVATKLLAAINADDEFTAVGNLTINAVRISNVHTGVRDEITDNGATGMIVSRAQAGDTMYLPSFESMGTSEVLICIASV